MIALAKMSMFVLAAALGCIAMQIYADAQGIKARPAKITEANGWLLIDQADYRQVYMRKNNVTAFALHLKDVDTNQPSIRIMLGGKEVRLDTDSADEWVRILTGPSQ